MKLNRRTLFALALVAVAAALSACDNKAGRAVAPHQIDAHSACDLDGMLLADYPGPKAQIFYVGDPEPHWFCDTVEMFSMLLKPEQVKPVQAVFVQDMGKADWDSPRGNWFDARKGFYVLGSKRNGSMGPTIASFAQVSDANAFAAREGGKVLRYNQVKPDMVDLTGGALHDRKM
ncbi:MAG: nitrous oxide reductase accessory protein NosL [Burkholderiaceae bacterium]|jgi:copper chaperone NosL|nr:nitrous oxide reductase accessory protein NosL [Burkholderiaceae bacterium]